MNLKTILPQGASQKRELIQLVLVVLALAAVRFLFAAQMELLPEEAYYWTYSQHPALGYFDHPPMVAWAVAAGTALLGNTELGVRLVVVLLSLANAWLLYATARMWFDARVSLGAVWIFSLLPVQFGTGLIATPDGPLLFGWLLALLGISKALHTQRSGWWALAGAGLGLGLLAKYTAIMLAPSLLLFLLLSRQYRFWLRRPAPWLALLVALAFFSPVIVWNAQNDWASFLFQSTRTDDPGHNALLGFPKFLLMHLGALSPIFFLLLVLGLVRAVRDGWWRGDDRWNFAASFSLPLFMLFVIASFKTQIHMNWTLPALAAMSIAGSANCVDLVTQALPESARRWRITNIVAAATGVVAIALVLSSLSWGLPRYPHALGWRQLGQDVLEAKTSLERQTGRPSFFLGADKYILAAEVGFYTGQPNDSLNVFALGGHGIGYRFWADLDRLQGWPAVVVIRRNDTETLTRLRECFETVEEPSTLVFPQIKRTLYLLKCYGYRPLVASAKAG